MKTNKWLALCLALVMILSMLLTGCGSAKTAQTSPTEEKPAATAPVIEAETKPAADVEGTDAIVTVAIDGEPPHLNLAQSLDFYAVWVTKNINDFLVVYDTNMEVQLSMAKKLDRVDLTTYEFEIYPGIKFHNGREVKAEDIKYSLEYVIDPANASASAAYMACLDNVEVTGDYTGIIHLKEPYSSFLNKLTMIPIIPQEAAADLMNNPIGCGPYKLQAWNRDQDIQLVKFDDYWKEGYPKNGGVTFKIIKEYTTIHNAFVAKEIDIIMWTTFQDIATWDAMDGVYAQGNELYDSFLLCYNAEVEPFDDPLVRKAIALALNKQELIDLSSMGYGKVLDQPVYPGTYFYNENASYSQNIEEAKKLLAEAGYPDGFSCDLIVPNTVQEGACGDIIQVQLKEIGIDCKLEKMDVGVFIDSVWGSKNFEMCVTGDGSDGDPDTWLRRWIMTGADNNFGYSNPELDALVAEGAAAATNEERKAAYDKAFEIISEEQPLTYLFGGYLYSALQDNIQGLVMYTNWWADFDGIIKK